MLVDISRNAGVLLHLILADQVSDGVVLLRREEVLGYRARHRVGPPLIVGSVKRRILVAVIGELYFEVDRFVRCCSRNARTLRFSLL